MGKLLGNWIYFIWYTAHIQWHSPDGSTTVAEVSAGLGTSSRATDLPLDAVFPCFQGILWNLINEW